MRNFYCSSKIKKIIACLLACALIISVFCFCTPSHGGDTLPAGVGSYNVGEETGSEVVVSGSESLKEMYKRLVTYKGVVYKNVAGQKLKLDILMPTKEVYEKIPVVVFVHGGFFTGGGTSAAVRDTRRDTTPKLLEMGYAVVSVEYRLCDGKNAFPENIIDVKDSIRWLYKNADAYNFDKKNIGIWGSSAGGHLALMAAYTGDDEYIGSSSLSSYPSKVNYVVNVNGVTDLRGLGEFYTKSEDKINILLGGNFKFSKASEEELDFMDECSPLYHITKTCVPTLIFHGTADKTVPISQSEDLYKKLKRCGCTVEYFRIPDARHGLKPISKDNLEMVSAKTLEFINRYYVDSSSDTDYL